MAQKKSIIIRELHKIITSNWDSYHDWYVGISKTPNDRLYDHKVEADFPYQYKEEAWSSEDAGEIKDYFVHLLKTDGGPSRGDESATWVYAYKKTTDTNP